MNEDILNRNSTYSRLAILLTIGSLIYLFPWMGRWHVIAWDNFGYYLYLPECFIWGDPGIRNYDFVFDLIRKYEISSTFYQVHDHPNGNHLIQYAMGMAILYSPAFFAGHLMAWISGAPQDGLSAPYEWAMLIEHYAVILLGLWLMRKFLLRYFSDRLTALLILIIGFGTNYYSLAYISVASPHIFLFALQALLLIWIDRYTYRPTVWRALRTGALLGLMTLTRPTEIIAVILIPLWKVDSFSTFKERVKRYQSRSGMAFILSFAIGFFICIAPQLLFWKKYAGEFFYYSYRNAGEGFDFATPHTWNFLFSFRKGWLIYTPVMWLTIAGFWRMFRERRSLFYAFFIYSLINIYVLSSWSNWWYAGSFSQRALCQSYTLLSLPLGYFLLSFAKSSLRVKLVLAGIILFLITLNLFQTWQAQRWIIHPSRNTMASYFAVFGRTEAPSEIESLWLVDRSVDKQLALDEKLYTPEYRYVNKLEGEDPSLTRSVVPFEQTENHVLLMNDSIPFSEQILIPYNRLTSGKDHAWIRIKLSYFFRGQADSIKPIVITQYYNRKKESYEYRGIHLWNKEFNAKTGVWNHMQIDLMTPEVRNETDNFSLSFWLQGKGSFFVDDIEITSFTKKE